MQDTDYTGVRRGLVERIAILESRLAKARNALSLLDDVFDFPRDATVSVSASAAPATETAGGETRDEMPDETAPMTPRPISERSTHGARTTFAADRGPARPDAPKTTRYERIEEVLRAGGGRLYMTDIVDGLIAMGDLPDGMTRTKFYNVVDSAMRSGRERGLFRKAGGKAEWELAPERGLERARGNGQHRIDFRD